MGRRGAGKPGSREDGEPGSREAGKPGRWEVGSREEGSWGRWGGDPFRRTDFHKTKISAPFVPMSKPPFSASPLPPSPSTRLPGFHPSTAWGECLEDLLAL